MKLTNNNYHSTEANLEYWSVSQYKSFAECEAKALAELDGEYIRPTSKSLLQGAYVDAHFSGEMVEFVAQHPEIFNTRTGELKADFRICDKLIARAEQDPFFMSFMDGDPQLVMTGELFDQPWKIKTDVLHRDKIVDLKVMRDMAPVYKDGERVTFIDAWGYDIQAYVYQQIVYQNTGKLLPFYFAVITKEEHPDIAVIEMPQWKIDSVQPLMDYYMNERFSAVKALEIPPHRCGKCDYCRDTKKLSGVMHYEELLKFSS